MFVFSETFEYDWPVIVHQPVDGGSFEKVEFTARFRVVPGDEAERLLGITTVLSQPSNAQVIEFLERAWIGWGANVTKDGQPFEFSDERRAAMLRIPFIRVGVMNAYIASVNGREEKN